MIKSLTQYQVVIVKTRPCVIISPDEMNRPLNTGIIQIRTIDKGRITKSLGELSLGEIAEIKSVIKETLVD